MKNDARNEGTRDTMPMHIYMHEVLIAAGVSQDEAAPHRARVQMWARMGEPVWMAADGLRFLVRQSALNARAERDGDLGVIRAHYYTEDV